MQRNKKGGGKRKKGATPIAYSGRTVAGPLKYASTYSRRDIPKYRPSSENIRAHDRSFIFPDLGVNLTLAWYRLHSDRRKRKRETKREKEKERQNVYLCTSMYICLVTKAHVCPGRKCR